MSVDIDIYLYIVKNISVANSEMVIAKPLP